MTKLLPLIALLAVACAPTQERPECADGALARIEAAYVAEVLEKCDGQHFDTCLERVRIDKKHDAIREDWVHCE